MTLRRTAFPFVALSMTGAMLAGSGALAPSAQASIVVVAIIPHDEVRGIGSDPAGIAVDPAADRAYVANLASSTVSIIDTRTNHVRAMLTRADGIGDLPTAVAADLARHQMYVVNSNSRTVTVIDTNTETVSKVIPHDDATGIGSSPTAAAVDTRAGRAYVTNFSDGTVSVIDTAKNVVIAVIPHDSGSSIGGYPTDVAVDEIQAKAYVANRADGTVSVVSTASNRVIKVIAHDDISGIGTSPVAVAVDAIHHRALVVNATSSTVSIIDTTTDQVVKVVRRGPNGVGAEPWDVATDAETGLAYVTNNGDGTVSVIDTMSGVAAGVITSPTGFGTALEAIAVDPSRGHAFVADFDSSTVAVLSLSGSASLSRIGGADRFAVSATVSDREFAPGVAVAYVASGTTFPDALSGSAAAGAQGAPVLLVTRDGIPATVAAELTRLQPQKIIILGGTASVSDAVQLALAPYAPLVKRLGGSDRFAVSAAISAEAFPSGAPVAYVASGAGFADALSASAAAAANHAPVLLTTRDSLPDAVLAELERLKPSRIVLVGGPDSVKADVQTALQSLASTIRLDGSDRFAVSAAVSANAFATGAKTVFVASGVVFPDALSGSAGAAMNGAPVLLVTGSAIPVPSAEELRRLKPSRIVVLGGRDTISEAVYEQLRAFLT